MRQNNCLILIIVFVLLLSFSCNRTKFPFGERIFLSKCADCHMDDGQGFEALYPSLKNETVIRRINETPCIVRFGSTDSTSLIKMLPLPELTAVEITNVMNYILQDLNNSSEQVQLQEVQKILLDCETIN